MPLGSNVSANIHELVHHGRKKRPHRQIVAIALNAARRAKGRKAHRSRSKR
jgi:ACT domain-containing protein